MTRLTLILTIALIMTPAPGVAQTADPEVPEAQRAKKLPRQHLAGPRFGFTTFGGDVGTLRADAGLSPVISQFGWQFETQILSTEGGYQALLEWLPLLGGLGQEKVRPTLSFLTGIRMPNGVEFGAGPNFAFDLDALTGESPDEGVRSALIVAAGATIPAGDLFIPVNLAVTVAEDGPRFTALMGWIIGS